MRLATAREAMCCDMLEVVDSSLKMVKFEQHPTCRNTVANGAQHVAPNNVAIYKLCWHVAIVRSFIPGALYSLTTALRKFELFQT